ncbi:hypothetical protein GE061_019219 [Apolygus lucorum]|uniref:CCDC174 alpha/beta GRSR domain-containing protein n=1 Tax=Apolygus lucorum TaxID=248454 RepID=A0A8S9X7U8_APOLU|nr:hypothetical protein GE061_019219 [Apolygus lucorum]
MKSGKTIDISKSSLVSLKAELIRKKEEADKLRGTENFVKLPAKPKPVVKTNPGVSERNERDVAEMTSEEVDLLQKSKDILKIKSSLYDQLQSGALVSDDGKSRYLVDFENKPPEPSFEDEVIGPLPPKQEEPKADESNEELDEDDEGWVEYKDCLGRSRKCLREDLPSMQKRDQTLSDVLLKQPPKKEETASAAPPDEDEQLRELIHSDSHLEELRKKWEQKEMELLSKQNVHYEDLLFDVLKDIVELFQLSVPTVQKWSNHANFVGRSDQICEARIGFVFR